MPADGRFCPNCRAPVVAIAAAQAAPQQTGTIYRPKCDHAMPTFGTCPNCNWERKPPSGLGLRWTIAIFVAGYWLVYIPAIINALFIYLDFKVMKGNLNLAHAHKKLSAPFWVLGGMFAPWVYLYRRASHTDRNYTPFKVSVAILQATAIAILSALLALGVFYDLWYDFKAVFLVVFGLYLALFFLYRLPRQAKTRSVEQR
jgi:hypothetical protein